MHLLHFLTRAESRRILSSPNLGDEVLRYVLKHLGISLVSICITLMLLEAGIRIANPQDLGFWDCEETRSAFLSRRVPSASWPSVIRSLLGMESLLKILTPKFWRGA